MRIWQPCVAFQVRNWWWQRSKRVALGVYDPMYGNILRGVGQSLRYVEFATMSMPTSEGPAIYASILSDTATTWLYRTFVGQYSLNIRTWIFPIRLCPGSNIVLFYSGILHAIVIIPMQILLLCSFHDWENTSNSKKDKHPFHWRPFLPTLHPHCCHRWSECYCPDASRRFSKFSHLTPSNLFAATWRFVHGPCYYFAIMLKCFWLAITPILCSA